MIRVLVDPGSLLLHRLVCAQGPTEGPELLWDWRDVCVHPGPREDPVPLGGGESGGPDTHHRTHVHGRQQEDAAHWRRVSLVCTQVVVLLHY